MPTMTGYDLLRPLLFRLPPETAHRLAITALQRRLVGRQRSPIGHDPALAARVGPLALASPLGLAAGFDKDAQAIAGCFGLGFGFVEVGGVTPRPQPGNPKPRVFRLPRQRALINRLGLNSAGHAVVAHRLKAARERGLPGPVGVNLGFNKGNPHPVDDYVAGVAAFAGLADFLTVNVSSPNTPGLRDLQERAALSHLLQRVRSALTALAAPPALFVKIAPDLDDAAAAAIAETVVAAGVDGLVVGNTTIARPDGLPSWALQAAGGLSGQPLRDRATALVARMARLIGPAGLPIIGVGGVASGADAYAKIRAGASAVQLYTALVYRGPGLVRRIERELLGLLSRDGVSVAEAVGADL